MIRFGVPLWVRLAAAMGALAVVPVVVVSLSAVQVATRTAEEASQEGLRRDATERAAFVGRWLENQALALLTWPEQFGDGKSGWTAIAAALIAGQPVQVQQNQSDGHASLVRFAFDIVERDQQRLPQPQLERWLAGDNATLAEKALLLLRRDHAGAEQPALERALQRSLLPAAMREFLLDHRRRPRKPDAALRLGSQLPVGHGFDVGRRVHEPEVVPGGQGRLREPIGRDDPVSDDALPQPRGGWPRRDDPAPRAGPTRDGPRRRRERSSP